MVQVEAVCAVAVGKGLMNDARVDLTGARVLIADDVPANLDVIYRLLRSEGYQVLVATDGRTTLDAVSQEKPDLILLDVMMPGMNGFEVCRRLKADPDLRKIPVIFVTAYYDHPDVQKGFQAGGADYVAKPLKREELLMRVRTQLENVFLARALEAERARRGDNE